jgi:hypothetical protein
MQMIAPEILEDVRQLHPLLLGAGLGIGLVLWLFGARSHRFWLSLLLTVCAGMVGLKARNFTPRPMCGNTSPSVPKVTRIACITLAKETWGLVSRHQERI